MNVTPADNSKKKVVLKPTFNASKGLTNTPPGKFAEKHCDLHFQGFSVLETPVVIM